MNEIDDFLYTGYQTFQEIAGHMLVDHVIVKEEYGEDKSNYYLNRALYFAELAKRCDEWYAEGCNAKD